MMIAVEGRLRDIEESPAWSQRMQKGKGEIIGNRQGKMNLEDPEDICGLPRWG